MPVTIRTHGRTQLRSATRPYDLFVSDFDPHLTPTRYLTSDVPGVGGVLKVRPEDFLVEEIPSYEPCGSGEHLYLWIQKINMSTMHVVRILADHFEVRRDAVGFAGLKDRMAVTTQLFSIHLPGKSENDFGVFGHPGITILWIDRHANKLRRGHLKGNRFVIRIRGTSASRVVHAHRAIAQLARLGVPNRIGVQRFGMIRRNHMVGRALLKRDHQGVLDAMLGPCDEFPNMQPEARALYAQGKFQEAIVALPGAAHTEKRVLAALARGASASKAVHMIEPSDADFFLTAMQSAVFNGVLDARIAAGLHDRLLAGDLAFKHDNGAVFAVHDALPADAQAALDERLMRLEISPSGPMWGVEMTRPTGKPLEIELEALAAAGLSEQALAETTKRARESLAGKRRPLRVPLTMPDVEAGVDEHGEYIKCVFELPRGSFATSALQEIMKTDVAEEDEG